MKYAITGGSGLLGREFINFTTTAPVSSLTDDICDAEAVDRWVYALDDITQLHVKNHPDQVN